jgi:hypothetical protein
MTAAATTQKGILIPQGTCTTTSELYYDTQANGPFTIMGYGANSVIKLTGTSNGGIHIFGTPGVTGQMVNISNIKILSATSGTSTSGIHLDGIALFSVRDVVILGSDKMTTGILLEAAQQGEIFGGYIGGCNTGIKLDDKSSVGSNGVEIHGISMFNIDSNVEYAGVDSGFFHHNHLETETDAIGVNITGNGPSGGVIIVSSNHIESHVTAGVKNNTDMVSHIRDNLFIGHPGALDIDLNGPDHCVIDGNLLNGNVTFGAGSSQLTFANNHSLGASITPGTAVFTNNSAAITQYGNKTGGNGFSLPSSKYRGDFSIYSVAGVEGFKFVSGGSFQILGAGMGIQMKNAADNVTRIIRLNDAGDGLIYDTP